MSEDTRNYGVFDIIPGVMKLGTKRPLEEWEWKTMLKVLKIFKPGLTTYDPRKKDESNISGGTTYHMGTI